MSRSKPSPRVYLPDDIPAHGVCVVPPEQSHHVSHVLRLAAGDAVTAFDGRGNEYAATIARISKQGVTLNVGEPHAVSRESTLDIVLAQGISSGDRMDYTVQKAVELGVRAIQPLATERSVVRLAPERAARRAAHWRGIAVAACEQCGRNVVPEVLPVAAFTAWLGTRAPGELRLTLMPGAEARLSDLERPQGRIVLLAGPEGGLSPRERGDAQIAGFTPVRLGPRVLRTETAALAAVAAMQTLWGDF
ncbi:MAG TPA: 16S rRNA (uracil(1498)-N(3))-methyltransferase [Burkholderiales bacterium]|nr:16S rRNA (uracil(1498)-N(3))-methyltransferase [Burkholderiales bacterium]